jgi:hypothetical protein
MPRAGREVLIFTAKTQSFFLFFVFRRPRLWQGAGDGIQKVSALSGKWGELFLHKR